MSGLALFILVAIVFPPLCALALARVLRIPTSDVPAFILYGLGIGPALLAWLVDILFRVTPGMNRKVYVVILGAVIAIVAAYSLYALLRPKNGILRRRLLSSASNFFELQGLVEQFILLALVAVVVFILLYNIAVPLELHDPIYHTVIAQILFRDLSAASYPFSEADSTTGFYLEGVHPLGFPASKIVFMLLAGDADTVWHKPMAGAYLGYLLSAVGAYSGRTLGMRQVIYASLLTASVPLLLNSSFIVHIDPLRVYAFFLPFAFLMEFLRSGNRCWLWATAIGTALGLHAHAGNILVIPFLFLTYFILSPESLLLRLRNIVFISIFAIATCGAQYIDNFFRYGTPAGTSYQLGPLLHLPEWEEIRRSITSWCEILIKGTLVPFTDFEWFGPAPWLGLFGVFLFIKESLRRWRSEPGAMIIILVISIYFALGLLAMATGLADFYKNSRYALIIIPFLSVAGSQLPVTLEKFIRLRLQCFGQARGREIVAAMFIAVVALLPLAFFVAYYWKRPAYEAILLASLAMGLGLMSTWPHCPRCLKISAWGPSAVVAVATVLPMTFPLCVLWTTGVEGRLLSAFWGLDRIGDPDLKKAAAAIETGTLQNAFVEVPLASRRLISDGSNILAFRDAEIYYYGSHRAISEFDRRLLPFYQAKDFEEADKILSQLDASFLYIPPYSTASMSHPYIRELLSDASRLAVVYQRGSFTILRYYKRGRPVDVVPLWGAEFREGLKLASDHWLFFPSGIGKCNYIATTRSPGPGMTGWFKRWFIGLPPSSPACDTMLNDENWIPLKNNQNTYRLFFETNGPGCLAVRLLFRTEEKGRRGIGFVDYDFTSVSPRSDMFLYLKPPTDSNAFVIALSKYTCKSKLRPTRISLEVLRETASTIEPLKPAGR